MTKSQVMRDVTAGFPASTTRRGSSLGSVRADQPGPVSESLCSASVPSVEPGCSRIASVKSFGTDCRLWRWISVALFAVPWFLPILGSKGAEALAACYYWWIVFAYPSHAVGTLCGLTLLSGVFAIPAIALGCASGHRDDQAKKKCMIGHTSRTSLMQPTRDNVLVPCWAPVARAADGQRSAGEAIGRRGA
jgi:hypothetical protein